MQPAGFWKLGMMCASVGRAPSVERDLERVDVDAVGLERDREDLGAELPQRQQRAVVGGRLDHHDVAGLDQLLEQEGVRLHRAVRGHDAVGLDAVLRRDPLEQVRIAGRGAVGERARRIALERALRGGRRSSTAMMSSDGAPRASEMLVSSATRRHDTEGDRTAWAASSLTTLAETQPHAAVSGS